MRALTGGEFAAADREQLIGTFAYIEFCLNQIVKDNELGALQEALRGEYIEPGPGGDPIRNPLVLPTGKNIHALDPQSIPTVVRGLSPSVHRLADHPHCGWPLPPAWELTQSPRARPCQHGLWFAP